MSTLFEPFGMGGLTLKNRIVMSPMCMYSAVDGHPNDFHLVHYGARALGGCAVVVQEATAVSPEGRISYADLGIWSDAHVASSKRVVDFVRGHGAVAAIQLAHAGRKGSCDIPERGEGQLKDGPNAWLTSSASPLPFHPDDRPPAEMSARDIATVIADFAAAARRAVQAGYQILEIHAAHGYLLHQFLSPLSNHRTDAYGGTRENRMRLPLEVLAAVQAAVPGQTPLWVRISAVEWVDGGWSLEDSVALAREFKARGVSLVDVSSGGNVPNARIPTGPGYQVPFAERIRAESAIATGAVGQITTPEQAAAIIREGRADLAVIGRQLLREPMFPLRAAHELGAAAEWPNQYLRGRWR